MQGLYQSSAGTGGRQTAWAVVGQAEVLVGQFYPLCERRGGVGHGVHARPQALGELGQARRRQVRVDLNPEQHLGTRRRGLPVSRDGQRLGPQFHIRAGSSWPGRRDGGPVLVPGPLPQRGPGQHDQVGHLVAQAEFRAHRVHPAPDLAHGDRVLRLGTVPGGGPLELRPPGEPVIAEQVMRLACHADLQRVGDPADGGDVAFQPDPPLRVGHGPFHVRVHGRQVPHGDLDLARLEPRMPRVGRGERLVDQVAERGGQVRADRRGGGEAGVQADQHPVVRGILGQGARGRRRGAVALLHRAAQRLPQPGALALQDRPGLRPVHLGQVVGVPGPPLPGAAEQPVQDDQAPHLAHPVLGQEPGQPHDRPGLQPALGQPVDPLQVLRGRVPGLVERVVDHEPPASRPGPEVVLGQPAGLPDVAEHHVHAAPRAAPDDGVRVGAEHVRVALGDPDRLPHQVLEQLAAAALVVLALGVLHHGLVVHVGQLHPDHRVARVAADVDLRHLPVPLPDLGQHDARLAARQRRPDRPVVERGQPGRGQLLQRRHLGRDRGQQQGLGQPVVGAERRGQPFRVPGGVLLGQVAGRQQDRPQLVPVQRGRRPEQRGGLRVQGIPALARCSRRSRPPARCRPRSACRGG